jgi:hypothetical protein
MFENNGLQLSTQISYLYEAARLVTGGTDPHAAMHVLGALGVVS